MWSERRPRFLFRSWIRKGAEENNCLKQQKSGRQGSVANTRHWGQNLWAALSGHKEPECCMLPPCQSGTGDRDLSRYQVRCKLPRFILSLPTFTLPSVTANEKVSFPDQCLWILEKWHVLRHGDFPVPKLCRGPTRFSPEQLTSQGSFPNSLVSHLHVCFSGMAGGDGV